jgi:hypothetical protein
MIAGAVLALACPSPTHATNYPWCSTGGEVGTPVCGYSSFEQCRMSARKCIENPRLEPTSAPRARRR